MANQPIIVATVKVTADDINGNNTAKQFNSVLSLSFDFNKGMVNVVDQTGSFFFSLIDITTLTYVVAGAVDGGPVTVVMS